MKDSFNNDFFQCFECNIYLCRICKSQHDKSHNIIEYIKINSICKKHIKEYTNYCNKCKYYICILCKNDHLVHEIINLKEYSKENQLRKNINNLINNVKILFYKFNRIKRYFKNYYKKIINEIKNKNYIISPNFRVKIENYNNILKDINKMFLGSNDLIGLNTLYKISDIIIKSDKKLKENERKIEKKYEFIYKNKEKEMYNYIQEILNDKKYDNNSICNTIHHEIKCNKCFINPIIGCRYKCSQCNNFNLCQICEEENTKTDEHPHNFIKIRKNGNNIQKIIINDKNKVKVLDKQNSVNGKKEDKEKEKEDYSFELNKNDLLKEIYEGENEVNFTLTLKNNKKNTKWPEGQTKLEFDEKFSNFIQKDINLDPLEYNEQKSYVIKIDGLERYPEGDYKIYLWFKVNRKAFGEKIEINLKIKEKQN